MEVKKAIEILRALADGVDPYTGEIMLQQSPYQNADTTRALYLSIKGLEVFDRRKQVESNLPSKAGNPWSSEEDQTLGAEFDDGITIKSLSINHERTEGAIRSRLIKLGKIRV